MDESRKYKYVQIKGSSIVAGEDLMKDIFGDSELPNTLYIEHIGIQSIKGHKCVINNEEIEIGKTGILEVRDVKITSFKFSQEENEETIVDCFLSW